MRYLIGTLLASTFLCLPVMAQDTPRPALKPRVEANLRAGTERSIAMSEFWVPLAQDNVAGSVLYGDARFMGDDKENNEFNLGVGYREIVTDVPVLGNGVAGVHGWVDRRHTERGAAFNQITAGAEWHGEVFDIKANAYIPLNKSKTHAAGTTTTAPYLAGSGIFYDITNMKLIEEAQPGFDLELGLNVSGIVDGFADSARIYAGAYHFSGDKSDDVTGWRTRVASDITQDVQIGARFQRDDERGSQGFLEATIRFPFGNKQSYKQHGLYARLDESPERDIDIVTGTVTGGAAGNVTETKPILNATSGDAQRVLYVDNSAGAGGTGTLNNPFNSLADAQADLRDNDVVYVARGDGLTTNMNAGFTINRSGVSLIGEGSAFVYDGGKFTAADANFSGTILKAAGLAPTITNNAGVGILISADKAFLSGVTVNGSTGDGVAALANGNVWDSVDISHVTVNGSGRYGLLVQTGDGTQAGGASGHIKNVRLTNVAANLSASSGVAVWASANGTIDNILVNKAIATQSTSRGVWLHSNGGGMIHQAALNDLTVLNNTIGFYAWMDRGNLDSVTVNGVYAEGNTQQGVSLRASSNLASGNISVNNAAFNNIVAHGNGMDGVLVQAVSYGAVNNATLTNVNAYGNTRHGIYIQASGTGDVTASVQGSTTTTNTQHGIAVYDDTSGTFEVDLGGGGRSAGRNTLMGNVLEDFAVDYDGRTIAAMNNWWGQAAGPYQSAPSGGLKPQIYYGAPINDGLVGHWTFDTEWTDGTTIYDRSGSGYHGVLQGGMTLAANQVAGQKRQALTFDGVNDWVNMGDVLNMGTNDFSIMTWGKSTSVATGNNNGLVYKKSTAFGRNASYSLNMPNGVVQLRVGDDANTMQLTRGTALNDGVWHQMGGVYDAGVNGRIYIDGAQSGAVVTAVGMGNTDSTQNFGIGARASASHPFQGEIDDVRVYNRTLTAAEVAELYRMSTDSVVNFGGFMNGAP